MNPGNLLPLLQGAGVNADETDAAEEGGGVKVGDVSLQGRIELCGRLGEHIVEDVEQFLEVFGLGDVAVTGVGGGGFAFTAGGVEHR